VINSTLFKQSMLSKEIGRGDIVIVLFVLIFIIFLYLKYWQATKIAGEIVHIVVAGEAPQKFSLLQNRILIVGGKSGDSRIQIEGGRVRFVSSICASKLCIHRGWLNFSGEIIACVPNQVSISISGQRSRFDTINF